MSDSGAAPRSSGVVRMKVEEFCRQCSRAPDLDFVLGRIPRRAIGAQEEAMSAVSSDSSKPALVPFGTLSEICRELASRPYARRGVPPAEVPIRVMLVDDHTIVRSGLRALLRTWPDITIVAEATNGEEAIQIAKRVQPQVILMDLDMPRTDGATATRAIADVAPNARVLILTMYPERE